MARSTLFRSLRACRKIWIDGGQPRSQGKSRAGDREQRRTAVDEGHSRRAAGRHGHRPAASGHRVAVVARCGRGPGRRGRGARDQRATGRVGADPVAGAERRRACSSPRRPAGSSAGASTPSAPARRRCSSPGSSWRRCWPARCSARRPPQSARGVAGFVAFGVLGGWAAARDTLDVRRHGDGSPPPCRRWSASAASSSCSSAVERAVAPADDDASGRARSAPVDRRRFLVGVGRHRGAGCGERRDRAPAARSRATSRPPATGSPPRLGGGPPPTLPAGVETFDGEVAGLSPLVTPNDDFYRIDTRILVPQVDPDGWSLRITGMVDREVELTFDELLAMDRITEYVTLVVRVQRGRRRPGRQRAVVRRAARRSPRPRRAAPRGDPDRRPSRRRLDRRVPDRGRRRRPAVHGGGGDERRAAAGQARLPGPARSSPACTATCRPPSGSPRSSSPPGRRSTATGSPAGWAKEGPIKTQSRIDVPRAGATVAAGRTPVAGVAWAPTRSIDRVEVRVDDGPWQPARLSGALSANTWVQWRYTWDATAGAHRLAVRATDGDGETQTARARAAGAVGRHRPPHHHRRGHDEPGRGRRATAVERRRRYARRRGPAGLGLSAGATVGTSWSSTTSRWSAR